MIEIKQSELTDKKSDAFNYLAIAIEHILKLTYATSNRHHNEWRNTISSAIHNFQNIFNDPEYSMHRQIRDFMKANYDEVYKSGLKRYFNSVDVYPDIYPDADLVPTTSPWELKEFVEMEPSNILPFIKNLPFPREFDKHVYMQLFPNNCIFLKDSFLRDEVHSSCTECLNYNRCLSRTMVMFNNRIGLIHDCIL